MGNRHILRHKSKLEKRRIGEYIFLFIFFIFFVVMALSLLYPLFWVLENSFKTNFEYRESSFVLPVEWKFEIIFRQYRTFASAKLLFRY